MENNGSPMNKKAFTLMELMIVVSIITVLFLGLIAAINPMSMINRAYDVRRKKDLDDAKKMLEQYMADTGCYPQPTQVCTNGNNSVNCTICTKKQNPKFSYFTKDICEPKDNSFQYMYETVPGVGNQAVACPLWFRIYSVLDSVYNANDDVWGCKSKGCGVSPIFGYSYLVTSPGAPVDNIKSNNWYCYINQLNRCAQCTPYDNCTSIGNACYGKELYPVRSQCCDANHLSPCI